MNIFIILQTIMVNIKKKVEKNKKNAIYFNRIESDILSSNVSLRIKINIYHFRLQISVNLDYTKN